MKSFAAIAAAAVALAPSAMGFTINTPNNIVQCQPFQFSWTQGEAPYYLSLIPVGQITAPPIKVFPAQDGLTYSWVVDLPQGTTFNTALRDKSGVTQYSAPATILPGNDDKCLNSAVTVTDSSSSSSTSSSGTSSPSLTPSSTPSGSGSETGSAARGSMASTFAIAGLLSLIGAALF